MKLPHDEATEQAQRLQSVRLRKRFPEMPDSQRRARSPPRSKKVRAGLRDMVPLLERCYDGCGTNPRAAEEQRDILSGRKARVDVGQLRLSYVCSFCNASKGSNVAGYDPETGTLVPLFNPRRDNWQDHFAWDGPRLTGQTPVARATIDVLAMNASDRVEHRRILIAAGDFLP